MEVDLNCTFNLIPAWHNLLQIILQDKSLISKVEITPEFIISCCQITTACHDTLLNRENPAILSYKELFGEKQDKAVWKFLDLLYSILGCFPNIVFNNGGSRLLSEYFIEILAIP